MKHPKVAATGEILMDMTPAGEGLYQANPGGAPANVLVQLTRLGIPTAFIGKAGEDTFGGELKETLDRIGVDTKNLILDPKRPTTLAFVHLSESGDRSFSFYRKNSADLALEYGELDLSVLEHLEWLHFGSLSLVADPAKETTLRLLEEARSRGIRVSYDPNLRENLWDSQDHAREMILKGMEYADLVKISDEELEFLEGPGDLETGARSLMEKYSGIQLLLITRGSEGADLFTPSLHLHDDPMQVGVKDTTGAGDSFMGAFLNGIITSEQKIKDIASDQWVEILHFATRAASFVVTRNGAIPAMGSSKEIEEFFRTLG